MSIREYFNRSTPRDRGIFLPTPLNEVEQAANDVVQEPAHDVELAAKRKKTSQHILVVVVVSDWSNTNSTTSRTLG